MIHSGFCIAAPGRCSEGCQHDKEEDRSHPLVLTALQVHWREKWVRMATVGGTHHCRSRRGERQSESERAREKESACECVCERDRHERRRDRARERESEREWHGILFKEPNSNREPPKRPNWAL